MKNIGLVLVCCLSTVAQAEYRMLMPLEVKNNGRLPDGSIVFSGANGPTTPVEPVEEATDCTVDIAAGTYYLAQEEVGETLIIKAYNGQRISNGIKGKLLDGSFETYGLLVYELCMNGQLPQTYVEPAETWANGECKYNTLGEAPQRYWTEVNNGNTQGEKVFQNASLGGSGYVSFYDNPQMSFFNFGVLYNYGRKVNSNSRFVYNGYTYYKGKYIYSIVNGYSYSDNYGGSKFTSPIDYYEVCRTQ
jgi:hypothetical protein